MDGGWKKLLFFGSVCVLLQVAHQAVLNTYQYILMKGEYDWMTASSYCRERYQGLATITTKENITSINSLMKPYPTRAAWIGLYKYKCICCCIYFSQQHIMDGGWKKLLFFGSVCVLLQVAHQAVLNTYQYILVKREYDWMTASSYCSDHYQGLATITTQENITRINSLMKPYPTRAAWIGLYDDVSGWKWSQPDEGVTAGAQEEFWNWQQGQPDNNGSDEHCVSMTAGGLWRDNSCTLVNLPFFCFDARSANLYLPVFEGMSWVEAQKFCRLYETDLASVRSLRESEEIQRILKELKMKEVWIGLHRDSWNWSDGTNFSFSSWSDGQPDNDVNPEACVSMLNGGWNDTLCSTRLYFICQGIPIASTTIVQPVMQRRTTTVKMKLMSNADLEDPAVSDDLLRQFAAALKSQGVTDVKLTWKTLRKEPQPTKRGGK